MDISVSQEQAAVPVTVITLKGTLSDNQELEAAAKEAHANGASYLLLDLTDVDYMSSQGLRALHSIYSMLQKHQADEESAVQQGIRAGTFYSANLKLLNPNKKVVEVLKVTGYDMFLEIYQNRQQALNAFG